MSWRPLLEGADAEAARAAIGAIADELAARDFDDPSLIHGAAGVALLHGQLAREGHPEGAARAHAALARALELLSAGPPNPWLGTGYVGAAWVMHHLADVVESDADTLEHIDGMVARLLARPSWPFVYGLWHGVVGLGVYALERGRIDLVARAVDHLDQIAERSPAGCTWWNPGVPELGDPSDHHDLGMVHGVAGAIAFLAAACAAGVPHARQLATDAVRWLLGHERAASVPRFPMHAGIEVPFDFVRNGWCHGDATIAAALIQAGEALGDPTLSVRAADLARAMACAAIDHAPDFDAAFCHGAAGRAHLFSRLAHALSDETLFDAARRYVRATLSRLAQGEPGKPALATGTSGIGLVLLAGVSTTEPSWDRVFLVTLPTR